MSFTLIETATVGSGGAANITFSSIPATFTDLLLVFSLRGTQTGTYLSSSANFNGSTLVYDERLLYGLGSGSGASASNASTQLEWSSYTNGNSSTANTFSSGQIYIPNYRSSAQKSVSSESVTENNATEVATTINAALWRGTDPITSIQLKPSAGNYAQHSSASLYGITAGSSGGVVVS